jgi:DNA polymerase-3 subunit epsilon
MSETANMFTKLQKEMVKALGADQVYISFNPDKKGLNCHVYLYQQKAFTLNGSQKEPFIEINDECFDIDPSLISANYKRTGAQDLLRIYIDLSFNIQAFIQAFLHIAGELRHSVNVDTFGCCGDFMECSDAKACVNQGDYFHLGCLYRRNLEAGRIFYGKNRNVEDSWGYSRTEKGKSLLELPRDFVLIDLETTGLSPVYDSIIEISAIRVVDLTIKDSWTSLINPGFELDDFIASLTGITDKMLESAPSLEDVIDDFLQFVGNDIVMGHNVNFDINFIYDNSMRLRSRPFTNNFVDTMRLSRRIFKNLPSHSLSFLMEYFFAIKKIAHRAKEDCLSVFDLYKLMLNHIESEGIDFAELVRKKSSAIHAADFVANTDIAPDLNNPLYQKVCVFTGKLSRYTRAQAMQLVANLGGINSDNVTKATDFLVLGNFDYISSVKEGKSSKRKKAEKLMLSGQDITIMPEDTFYDMISSDNS